MRPRSLLMVFLAAGLLAACSVRYVSPYNAEIATRAATLYQEVIGFELMMRRAAGTPAGDPRDEDNQHLFDAWAASVATMATISTSLDPRAVRCQDLLAQGSVGPGLPVTDCGTLGINRLGERIEQLRALYDGACRVPGLADGFFDPAAPPPRRPPVVGPLPGCAALWTPPAASAALGLTGPRGLAVDPVLRSIRAVMVVQEAKRGQ